MIYILILAAARAAAVCVFRFTRSGKYAEKLKPAGVFLVRAFAVCMMLELLVFNFNAAHLLGGSYPRKTLALQDAYTENFDASTGRNPGSGRTVLEFTGLNTPVRNKLFKRNPCDFTANRVKRRKSNGFRSIVYY